MRSTYARPVYAPWEFALVGGAALAALLLGGWRLGVPSLWHDELVHAYVARALAESGTPTLPSGRLFPGSFVYHLLLAPVIAAAGLSEASVRSLSVVAHGATLPAAYALARHLLGRPTAVAALLLLLTSPWAMAWAQQAKPYQWQTLLYLLFCAACWRAWAAPRPASALAYALAAGAVYLAAVATVFHGLLFVAGPGLFCLAETLRTRAQPSRAFTGGLALALAGAVLLLTMRLTLNEVDQTAVFRTGLGTLPDLARLDRLFYARWLWLNLSLGWFLVASFGLGAALWRGGHRGWYVAACFVGPLLVLTFVIGYRRPRFLYFAYPFYVMLAAYGLAVLAGFARTWRHSLTRTVLALAIALFGLRLAVSTARLSADTWHTARGADLTLARRQPQWRAPCTWVREHATPQDAILTTTYLPVLHYTGRVDQWFPNRFQWWEYQESGLGGLAGIPQLEAWLAHHPRGYFIAEKSRWDFWREHGALTALDEMVRWVEANMQYLEHASSADVRVYAWGQHDD